MDIQNDKNNPTGNVTIDTASVADVAMAALGLSHIAYIRTVQDKEGNSAFMICAADGSELAAFSSYDLACHTARQHNLQPMRLH